eukprot:gene16682-18376_t
MADKPFEVIIDGGGPWGFRLQGGKDFGIPLNIARVTPGSKAAIKLLSAGDIIQEINNVNTENLNHMEAQNLIKNAGTRLQLKIKKGKGVSIGDQNAAVVGNPKLLTETKVVHSANIDHGFNTKPRAFGSPSSPPPSVSPAQPVTVSHSSPPPPPPISAPKFDSGAYARRKKEELEQRKKEQNIQAEDSEILKMINATHISSKSPPPPQSNEEAGADPGAFRMVYSGRDIHEEASPGAKSVISSLKEKVSQEKSGLNSESKVPSRAFQMLQKQLDEEDPEGEAPPVDKDRVFRMTYDSRDIHTASISAGSMDVMNSLKEKIAEKRNSVSYQPKKTPSRLHAMLQSQYGEQVQEPFEPQQIPINNSQSRILSPPYDAEKYNRIERPKERATSDSALIEEPEYGRFRSDQSKHIPSKVFQALQYCYPAEDNHGNQPDPRPTEDQDYERFHGNKAVSMPSKVFQALQCRYPGEDSSALKSDNMQVARSQFEDGSTAMRSSNSVPSKAFQMLQKQYSDDSESSPQVSIQSDLQDALDLLEKELEFMTSSKRNPIIKVPLGKGVHTTKPQTSQTTTAAPPIPIRVDSKKFKLPPKFDEEGEEIMHAPLAKIEPVIGNRRNSSKSDESSLRYAPSASMNNVAKHKSLHQRPSLPAHEDGEFVAPLSHVEKDKNTVRKSQKETEESRDIITVASTSEIVAYSAEVETPWLSKKNVKINPALSARHQNIASSFSMKMPSTLNDRHTGYSKIRSDSYDSTTSSHSSQQDRIPDFDPDTYIVTRKTSLSSHGLRSASSDSSQSYSSCTSGKETAHNDEEADRSEANVGFEEQRRSHAKSKVTPNAQPKRMVINVNGRTRLSESSEQSSQDKSNDSNNEMPASNDQRSHYSSQGSVDSEMSEGKKQASGMKITFSTKAVGKSNQNNGYEDDSRPNDSNDIARMMNLLQVDESEKEIKEKESDTATKSDETSKKNKEKVEKKEEPACQELIMEEDNGSDFSKLEAVKLEDLNSEEITEVHIEDVHASPILSKLQSNLHSEDANESLNPSTVGKHDATDSSKTVNKCRPDTAVYIQKSRKQQKQINCIQSGPGRSTKREDKSEGEKAMSPPVNVQMQKNSRKSSVPLGCMGDDYKSDTTRVTSSAKEPSSPSRAPISVSSSKAERIQSNDKDNDDKSSPPDHVHHDSIVATEVVDNDDISAEKLQKTFEMINATADRILDQIDKVGSLGGDFSDEFKLAKYSTDDEVFEDYQDVITRNAKPSHYGARISLRSDGNQRTSQNSGSSSNLSPLHTENGFNSSSLHCDNDDIVTMQSYNGEMYEEVFSGSNTYPHRVTKRVVSSIKPTATGVKITMPAFSVKVSQRSSNSPRDLPPPPPELIGGEEEEGSRPSFGSYAAPGVQSRTFRHLQEAVETGDGHQSVFSRPHGERNKAVPLPSQQPKMVAPQVTTVNPIPKAPMPTGPNFKISSTPKAPSFKANAPSSSSSSSSSSYKPPYNASPTKNPPTSPPAFKPSPSPQAVVTPQTTTAKVPSSKPAGMPLDPSRIPVCHGCNDQIKGPFVSAIGKTWHPEHFCCDSCKKSLQNQGFVEEADKLYCEQCFNRYFAPKCASCGHAIIGVNGRGTMLCNYCTTVRSTGEELEPRSLRELIISIKHDIQQENSRTNQLIALKEDALMRWKTAYGRQREVRKDLVEIEEKNQRLEQRLENAENRLKMINSNLKTIEENKSQLKGNERDRKQNEEWLTNEVEKARKRNKIMMQELSKKLSFLSQRGLHLRFIQDKSDSSRLRIIDLENDIELLRRRKEFIISQGKAAASNRIREFALIEQLQDDIMICNRRSEKAKSKIYQYEIRKDDLIGEIEYQRERRREAIDHLQSAIKNCINAVGKTYHPEHFLCERCGKNFASEGFLIEMGKPYCEKCHDETFGVKCAGCNGSISGGQRYVEALNQNWHTDCFMCGKCHTRLEGSSFYVVGNRPYCGLHKGGM